MHKSEFKNSHIHDRQSLLYVQHKVYMHKFHACTCVLTGINTNRKFENGTETMISVAVQRGNVGIVDLLVKKGADVNIEISGESLHLGLL